MQSIWDCKKVLKTGLAIAGLAAAVAAPLVLSTPAQATNLGSNIAMGYWDNWGTFTLQNSPSVYKVLFYAFAVGSGADGATIVMYTPSGTNPLSNLKNDITTCHGQGRKVLLSIGGATSANITLQNSTDVTNFVNSVTGLINTYGFDGIDLDLENSSLTVNAGDSLSNPSTPDEANLANALSQLSSHFGANFLISLVPETADIDAYGTYSGIWGSYLPVINKDRGIISLVDIQCYNSGSMYAANGTIVSAGGADFAVAMSELMLHGYTVSGGQAFTALAQQQVAFGSLNTSAPSTAVAAWKYLRNGTAAGGSYHLLGGPYGNMAGMMVWDINGDVNGGQTWASAFSSAGLTGTANGGTTGTTTGSTTGTTTGSTTGGVAPSAGVHTLTPGCATGSRLDDNAAGTTNGTKIQIWTANGSNAQNWNFASVGTNTWNLAVNLGPYCLDGGAATVGTATQLWSCNGTNDQAWVSGAAAQSGAYNFASKQSGLCLDVRGAASANGTVVQSYTCNGTPAQAWTLH